MALMLCFIAAGRAGFADEPAKDNSEPSRQVFELSDENFDKKVAESPLPLLVHFTAAWAGPSRAIKPFLSQIAEEQAGKLRVASIDVDQNSQLAQRFKVMSMPTLILLQDGKEKARRVGGGSKAEIERLINGK